MPCLCKTLASEIDALRGSMWVSEAAPDHTVANTRDSAVIDRPFLLLYIKPQERWQQQPHLLGLGGSTSESWGLTFHGQAGPCWFRDFRGLFYGVPKRAKKMSQAVPMHRRAKQKAAGRPNEKEEVPRSFVIYLHGHGPKLVRC